VRSLSLPPENRAVRARPFLRWAGGKRWLLKNYSHHFPVAYRRYVEPFIGGGAVFFGVAPESALIADSNSELIATYKGLRNDLASVLDQLRVHAKRHGERYYYEVRDERPTTNVAIAARMIYLNKACWNGLYRVNGNGDFNVPYGDVSPPRIDEERLRLVSKALRIADIENQDFERTINSVRRRDFVFVDPPYTVRHNKNGFIKYNQKIFSWEDQERLAKHLELARQKGAQVVISNADHKSIRDLYSLKFWNHLTVYRSSTLASDASKRGAVSELLIKSKNCN
jgi:DNA adenine methylase